MQLISIISTLKTNSQQRDIFKYQLNLRTFPLHQVSKTFCLSWGWVAFSRFVAVDVVGYQNKWYLQCWKIVQGYWMSAVKIECRCTFYRGSWSRTPAFASWWLSWRNLLPHLQFEHLQADWRFGLRDWRSHLSHPPSIQTVDHSATCKQFDHQVFHLFKQIGACFRKFFELVLHKVERLEATAYPF